MKIKLSSDKQGEEDLILPFNFVFHFSLPSRSRQYRKPSSQPTNIASPLKEGDDQISPRASNVHFKFPLLLSIANRFLFIDPIIIISFATQGEENTSPLISILHISSPVVVSSAKTKFFSRN